VKFITHLFHPAQVSLELGLPMNVDDVVSLEKAGYPQWRNKADTRYLTQIRDYVTRGLEIVYSKSWNQLPLTLRRYAALTWFQIHPLRLLSRTLVSDYSQLWRRRCWREETYPSKTIREFLRFGHPRPLNPTY
jgi:hypothetical protein